jgi:predicted nucleotidyltransferase
MNFQELLAGIELDAELTLALEELLYAKSQSKEIGLASRVDCIDAFITAEFAWAKDAVKTISGEKSLLRQKADEIFRQLVKT